MVKKLTKLLLHLIIYIIFLFVMIISPVFPEQKNNFEEYSPIIYFEVIGWFQSIEYLNIYPDGIVKTVIPDVNKIKRRTGKLSSEQLENLINVLKNTGITDDDLLPERDPIWVFDHTRIYMGLYLNNHRYSLSSLHPFYKENNNWVVTQEGIIHLEPNETKEAYFNKHASDEYKIFLKIWDQCFQVLNDLYLNITGQEININPDLLNRFVIEKEGSTKTNK